MWFHRKRRLIWKIWTSLVVDCEGYFSVPIKINNFGSYLIYGHSLWRIKVKKFLLKYRKGKRRWKENSENFPASRPSIENAILQSRFCRYFLIKSTSYSVFFFLIKSHSTPLKCCTYYACSSSSVHVNVKMNFNRWENSLFYAIWFESHTCKRVVLFVMMCYMEAPGCWGKSIYIGQNLHLHEYIS